MYERNGVVASVHLQGVWVLHQYLHRSPRLVRGRRRRSRALGLEVPYPHGLEELRELRTPCPVLLVYDHQERREACD